MDRSQAINPFLSDNFAPIHSEDDFADLPVRGEIPKGLRGSFYRNGPNPQFEPRETNHHWFFGDGMVHAFHVAEGKVSYLNRYVHTNKYLLEKDAGRSLFGAFGNPLTSDPSVIGKESGIGNTNIVWHGGRLLALEEAHNPFEMDPITLESRGYRDYAKQALRFTAHPKMDPETGEMVYFAYSAGPGVFSDDLAYGVADRNGKVMRLDTFKAPYCSMVHDFFVTRNYVMFPVLPLTGNLQRAMNGKPGFAWEPDKGSHIGVMRRDASVESMRWFTTDACYVLHPMNAWEEGEKIFADVMEYAAAPLFPNADGSMAERANARLVRWTFNLAGNSNTVKREQIDDLAGEFPRFDERRAGLAYRHGWFAGVTAHPGGMISRYDLAHRRGQRATHRSRVRRRRFAR